MSIKELTEIKWKEIKRETIIHYPEVKDLCARPYPGHPKGCPNQEKCNMLNIPPFEIIDKCGGYTNYYVIYCIFDRKKYRESKGGRDNLRWWQGSIKSLLKKKILEILKNNPRVVYYLYGCGSGFKLEKEIGSMENSCINVFSTMKLNGVKLELNPRDKVILVCLISSNRPLKIPKDLNERVKCSKCGKDLGEINYNKLYLCENCQNLFYIKRKEKTILDWLGGNKVE